MSTDLTLKDRISHTYFPYARWRMLPLEAVSLTEGFWFRRQKINREITLVHGNQMLEKAGNFHNLRVAAGLIKGEYRGREFLDSDVYKWLESAAYELYLNPDNTTLQQQVDEGKASLDKLRTDLQVANGNLEMVKGQMSALTKERDLALKKAGDANKTIQTLKAQLAGLTEKFGKLQSENATLEKTVKQLREKLKAAMSVPMP